MISLPAVMAEFSLGSSPSIDSEVTDLPLPDSPTRATVAFLGMSKLMPFTASKLVFLSRRKLTRRLRTERSGSMGRGDPWRRFRMKCRCALRELSFRATRGICFLGTASTNQIPRHFVPRDDSAAWPIAGRYASCSWAALSFQFRIQRVPQRIGEQAERRDQQGHRGSGRGELPPLAQNELVLGFVQHRSPRHDVDGHAESQK